MKKIVFLLLISFTLSQTSFSQSVSINNDASVADASAALDVKSTTKGMLVPRMTMAQRDAVVTPAIGLLIYQTDNTTGFYSFSGSSWTIIGGSKLPSGTVVMSETYHDLNLMNNGFSYLGYLGNNLYQETPVIIPAKTWYIINQHEPNNASAPSYDILSSLSPTFYDEILQKAFILKRDTIFYYDPVNDVYTFSLLTNSTIITPNDFSGITHNAILAGQYILMWGENYNGNAAIGIKLNLQTLAWSTISTINQPSVRDGHTSVWTGSKMLVWGGVSPATAYPRDGGQYDLASNSWTAIPSASIIFPGRINHTAVWDGTELIVFGGKNTQHRTVNCYSTSQNIEYDTIYNLSSCFKYNPATNVYSVVFQTALSARNGHTATWTGTEMVVWGGEEEDKHFASGNCTTPTNHIAFKDGAKYNPATNTWTAIPVNNSVNIVPVNFQAIICGSRILFSSGNTKNVLVYNPSSNSWVTNDFPNAPTNLYSTWYQFGAFVWTGSRLINLYGFLTSIHNLKGYAISDNPVTIMQSSSQGIKNLYLYKKN